ncbi:hypothetical protein [Nonomuraea sp. NPDC003201]
MCQSFADEAIDRRPGQFATAERPAESELNEDRVIGGAPAVNGRLNVRNEFEEPGERDAALVA